MFRKFWEAIKWFLRSMKGHILGETGGRMSRYFPKTKNLSITADRFQIIYQSPRFGTCIAGYCCDVRIAESKFAGRVGL